MTVLPMGFSFALHWAQQAHLSILRRAGVIRGPAVLFDFHPVSSCDAESGQIVYVDNGIFCSTVPGVAMADQSKAADVLRAHGLPIHDVTTESSELESLGLALHSDSAKVKPERRMKLKQAVRALLERPRVSGKQLEVIIGDFTFCALLSRPFLSVFQCTYTYINRHYNSYCRLW